MIDKLKILQELKKHLRKHYSTSVKDVILFGSQSIGKGKADSDFDILVVLTKPYSKKDEEKILDICYEIDLKYNILIDIHLLSQNELNTLRGKQPIYLNALSKGIYA